MAEKTLTLTGVLKISIPDPALKVTLTFETSHDGDSWTEAQVIQALAERGLRDAVPRKRITEFFHKAAQADSGPVSEIVLKGLAPVPPVPDTPAWERLDVPSELQPLVKQVLADAGPPVIVRTVQETVERKQEVVQKAGFPFLREKREEKTVRETVERQEKVFVDPTVHSVLFTTGESLLGRIVPRTAGIPGRDVFGRTIPVQKPTDPAFYLGANVERRGEEIHATTAGLIRIGHNWADLVPFSRHEWSVELSTDRATCYLNFVPGHRLADQPAAEEILQAADQMAYPRDSLMSAGEIEKLVRGQIVTGESGRLSISSSRDASVDISVTEDRLEAYLNVHKGKGRGKPLSLREIGAVIKESGLRKLDFDRIKTDITAFYESNEMDLTDYLLCTGHAPVPGPERTAEYAITFNPEDRTTRIREDLRKLLDVTPEDEAHADVHLESFEAFPVETIQKTAEVKAEQLLCTLDPPVPGEPGMDVYGMTIPPEPGPIPDIRIFENIKQLDTAIVTTSPGILDYREEGDTVYLRVRPHQDAKIEVSVSGDKMQALLTMTEGAGSGARLTREAIDQELARLTVVHGISEDAIQRALDAARAGVPVRNLAVAEGTAPIDQSESRVEFLVDIAKHPPVRIRKDGTADYRSRGEIVTVEKEQEICLILPSHQEAVDGVDVLGNTVPAKKLGGAPLELGPNLHREERSDGTILVQAEIEGELHYDGRQLELLSTHTVNGDVNMSVGNIRFPGSVIISGTVRSGFYVISTGDITIGGGVEGALLSSDGDIIIKEGVKGAGKAVLRSKQNIMSPFVELATVLAVGNLVLKSALVRSRIKCNGKISFQGDKGRILGGTIRARNGFEVNSVGSPRGVKTQISFGQDYLVADLIEKEEQEIEKVKRRITQVDMEMRRSEKSADAEGLAALRKEKIKLLKLMEKRGLRLFTLRERFEQHFPSKVVVRNEVHTGTVFESHGRTHEITHPRKAIAVEFNPQTGNIDINDLNGH